MPVLSRHGRRFRRKDAPTPVTQSSNCPSVIASSFLTWCAYNTVPVNRVLAQAVERKTPKLGRWWRQLGYNGPKYCQRCSEVFRDHIQRQKPNSAGCSRQSPCDDCAKVMRHFDVAKEAVWERMDVRTELNRQKKARTNNQAAAALPSHAGLRLT